MNLKTATVIGGGIHGIACALALADRGLGVTLLEKRPRLLQGTSGATQNRAHMGYHYPRSPETAKECWSGLEIFKNRYPEALFYPKEAYYAIAKKGSLTSPDDFVRFCASLDLPCKEEWPEEHWLSRDRVSACFGVDEPVYDLPMLKQIVQGELEEKKVTVRVSSNVIAGQCSGPCDFRTSYQNRNHILAVRSDLVINATYADTNLVQAIFGIQQLSEYDLQITEILRLKCKVQPPAITVLDGPFCTVLPQGQSLNNLLYHAQYSVTEKQRGHFTGACIGEIGQKPLFCNAKPAFRASGRYFPFLEDMNWFDTRSLFGTRPILLAAKGDSRQTRLLFHASVPGFISIAEGKFISAFLIADKLVGRLQSEGVLPAK